MTLQVENRIPGWRLHVARLDLEPGSHELVMGTAIKGALSRLHRRFPDGIAGEDTAVGAVRESLGCDGCTRQACRPSSERLAARLLAGESYSRSFLSREFRDVLTLRMMLPWGVMDTADLGAPLVYRRGEPGESVEDHGKIVDLEGLPILTDGRKIVSSPCTSHDEDALREDSPSVIFVSYTPMSVWRTIQARTYLSQLIWMSWAYRFAEERAFKPME